MSLLRFVGAEIADLHFPVNGFSSRSRYYFWLSLLWNVAWRLRRLLSNMRTIGLPALPYLADAGRGSIFFDDTDGNHKQNNKSWFSNNDKMVRNTIQYSSTNS